LTVSLAVVILDKSRFSWVIVEFKDVENKAEDIFFIV